MGEISDAELLRTHQRDRLAETTTPEAARHVLGHLGHPDGYQPGSFTALLIQAIHAADQTNTARLRLGFPEYVAAVRLATHHPDGIETLRRIASERSQR